MISGMGAELTLGFEKKKKEENCLFRTVF